MVLGFDPYFELASFLWMLFLAVVLLLMFKFLVLLRRACSSVIPRLIGLG